MSFFVAEVDPPAQIYPPPGGGAFALHSADVLAETGRWTILGGAPRVRLWWRDGLHAPGIEVVSERAAAGVRDPLQAVARLIDWFGAPAEPEAIRTALPFIGGAVGYLSYELGRHFERVPVSVADPLRLPDLWLGLHGGAVVVDRIERRAWAVGIDTPFASAPEEAGRVADEVLASVPAVAAATDARVLSVPDPRWHEAAVGLAQDYITAGDVYQVNITGPMVAATRESARSLWQRMTESAPAPFAAFLDCHDHTVLSASPERFLSVRGRRVETRPIKGTRPRGLTPAEDRRLAAELSASEKDRAELLMIVDLHRNDLGRVCEIGSVAVPTLFGARAFSSVHHLEATVTGHLAEGKDRWDLLRASFPAGSITGAPKIRAMEIIAELEPTQRGAYCGAIGYFDVRGDMDLSVAIRTAVVEGERVVYGAGGGIVADSDPAAEYEELLLKTRPLRDVLGLEKAA